LPSDTENFDIPVDAGYMFRLGGQLRALKTCIYICKQVKKTKKYMHF